MSERRSDGESPLSIAVGFLTDVGRQRERNEDAYYVYVPYPGEPNRSFVDGLFAVADGMGGHDAGDVASRIAVETVKESFLDPGAEAAPDPHGFARQLDQLFQEINRRLVDYARQQKMDRGIGSTLTLAALRGSDLQIAHVGDTRCYRLRTGNLERLTEDHTWVAQQRKAGLLTPEEEASHPKRNLLTQALGTETGVRVDLHTESVEAGDRYLICCDGLHGLIEEPSIARVLGEENDPQQALRRLVRQANDAGGNDNITGVTFYLTEAAAAKAGPEVTAPRAQVEPGEVVTVPPSHIEIPAPVESRSSRWPIWGGLAVLLVAVAGVGWLWVPSPPPGPPGEDAPVGAPRECL